MIDKNIYQANRAFFGRVAASLGLYVLFLVSSGVSALSDVLQDWPWVSGAFLIAAVFLLPRSTRSGRLPGPSAQQTGPAAQQAAQFWQGMQKKLMGVRLGYLIGAIFMWLMLPGMLG